MGIHVDTAEDISKGWHPMPVLICQANIQCLSGLWSPGHRREFINVIVYAETALKAKRLGDHLKLPVTTLLVEVCFNLVYRAWVEVRDESEDSKRATIPKTWGGAIEVPEMASVAVFDPIQAEVMPTPGAMASTHWPQDEKVAIRSARSVALTVKEP